MINHIWPYLVVSIRWIKIEFPMLIKKLMIMTFIGAKTPKWLSGFRAKKNHSEVWHSDKTNIKMIRHYIIYKYKDWNLGCNSGLIV